MRYHKPSVVAVSALVAMPLFLASCATSRMALPPTLSKDAHRMPVKKTYAFWIFGLKSLDFGPYSVVDHSSGWNVGQGTALSGGTLGYSADKSAQKYSFRMKSPSGKTWAARCAEAAANREVSANVLGGTLSANLERQATLDCEFQKEQGEAPWKLSLALRRTGEGLLAKESLAGTLSDSASSFSVEGTHGLEGTTAETNDVSGFSIRDTSKVLGAVQTISEPVVWMDPAAESQYGDPFALASAALMLQEGLLKKLDEKEKK